MIIVTGGAGFIGSAVVWRLNQNNRQDIVIVDELGTRDNWQNLVSLRFDRYVQKRDLFDFLEDCEAGDVEAIIHMGACSATTETDMDYLYENNTLYTQYLAEWCIDRQCRFIYASSAATYGDGAQGFDDDPDRLHLLRPINRYGYSKQLMDLYASSHQMLDKIVGLKFFNVFGPNEYHKGSMRSVVCKAFSQIQDTGAISLFKSYHPDYPDGGQKRDFIYVKDCVAVILWLLEHPQVNGLFNVGTGQSRTWNELATALFKAMDRPLNIQYIEMPETLRNQYQYFTEASVLRLQGAGYDVPFTSLQKAVSDYVHYLDSGNKFFS